MQQNAPTQAAVALAICWVSVLMANSARAELPPFEYARPIVLPEDSPEVKGTEGLVGVDFDDDVYAATRDGFPDVRIRDDRLTEVPFVIEQAYERRVSKGLKDCPIKVESLKELPENRLEVIVALTDSKAGSPREVTVNTPLKNFERFVDVYGSRAETPDDWKPLIENALLYDYSRYMDVRNTQIRLPENTYRRFRFVFHEVNATEESPFLDLTRHLRKDEQVETVERTQIRRQAFRIDRLQLQYETVTGSGRFPVQRSFELAIDRVTEDTDKKQTLVELRSRRQPIRELHLQTDSRNFSRRVDLEAANDPDGPFQSVGSGTISVVEFGRIKRSQLTLLVSEVRRTHWRLRIHNGDSPPIGITAMTASGPTYRAVFLTEPGRTYELLYGSPAAPAPSYDTASVLAQIPVPRIPRPATLGPPVRLTAAPLPAPVTVRGVLEQPWLVIPLLLVLVAVLTWGIYRAVQRVDQLPGDNNTGNNPPP